MDECIVKGFHCWRSKEVFIFNFIHTVKGVVQFSYSMVSMEIKCLVFVNVDTQYFVTSTFWVRMIGVKSFHKMYKLMWVKGDGKGVNELESTGGAVDTKQGTRVDGNLPP